MKQAHSGRSCRQLNFAEGAITLTVLSFNLEFAATHRVTILQVLEIHTLSRVGFVFN